MAHSDQLPLIERAMKHFMQCEGRRPRILIARMGIHDHDHEREQIVIATAYADLGFDVDISPLLRTPEEVARQAVDNDVHMVDASSLAVENLTPLAALEAALASLAQADIQIVVNGLILPQSAAALWDPGAASVLLTGITISKAAPSLLESLLASLEHPPVPAVAAS